MKGIRRKVCLVTWFLLSLAIPAWSAEVGDRLPEFTIRTFAGHELSRKDLQGKPALLVFWNTWCSICLRELPEIDHLAKKYGPLGLTVVAINSGYNDSEAKARTYWKKYAFVFPSGYDHSFEFGQSVGLRGVPTIYLIDNKGTIRYKHSTVPPNMDEHFERLSSSPGAR